MAFGCNCHKLLPKCRWFDSGPRDPFFLQIFYIVQFLAFPVCGLPLPRFFSCRLVGSDNGCGGRICGDKIGALCL
ncbi:hypothetical protein F5Y00DRAFT_233813 [Daldinia vernicosa]|uniref:uncharacterized protein n=1 Tax=Daldinia vernicosa TaxID=114800 RepID=UPI002008E74B|nr:uncharacterized protein F5Y00DRAFT_233813 [Daldinia vernicosa]KAI0850176.1 hypothetical protein F5Y00DRAFT_233813 [Daldinia vernicosa]